MKIVEVKNCNDDLLKNTLNKVALIYVDKTVLSFKEKWAIFSPVKKIAVPKQGWKIHLSLLPNQLVPVIERISSLLIEEEVFWKTAPNINSAYNLINNNSISNAGKIITVYPNSDNQFRKIIEQLYNLTFKFYGPTILNGNRFKDSKCLFYRYGSFTKHFGFNSYTGVKNRIMENEGNVVEDIQKPGLYKPQWIDDILGDLIVKDINLNQNPFKGIEFLKALKQSTKGGVFLAKINGEKIIIKEARVHVCIDDIGRDARDRLQNEFNVLKTLSSLKIAPIPIKIFSVDSNKYLQMEYIQGKTLRKYIEEYQANGESDSNKILSLCKKILVNVVSIHQKGIVIRDLTPNNILVTPSGEVKMIDLELGCDIKDSFPFKGITPGYYNEVDKTHYIQDEYALGAIFYYMSTGVDPFFKYDNQNDLLSSLKRFLYISVSDVKLLNIGLLGLKLMSNHHNLHETQENLNKLIIGKIEEKKKNIILNKIDKDIILSKALSVVDHLNETVDFSNEDMLWKQNSISNRYHISNFNSGVGGVAYFLCEIYEVTKNKKHLYFAKSIIDWLLKKHKFIKGETPIFAYFGYGMIPLIIVKIGKYLGDYKYIEVGLQLARSIGNEKVLQFNVSHGAAGLGLIYLEIYKLTNNKIMLIQAQEMMNLILNNKRNLGNLVYWDAIEQKDGKIIKHKSIGFSHGIAGIGTFLLAMYTQTNQLNILSVIKEILDTLSYSKKSIFKGKGAAWTHYLDNRNLNPWIHWCNGTSGVCLFLANTYKILRDDISKDLLFKSLYTITRSEVFGSFCQCHGLAGNGDVLNYVYKILGDDSLLKYAQKNMDKLLALKYDNGKQWLWTLEDKDSFSPEFMTGYLGVYSFMLRMFFNIKSPMILSGYYKDNS